MKSTLETIYDVVASGCDNLSDIVRETFGERWHGEADMHAGASYWLDTLVCCGRVKVVDEGGARRYLPMEGETMATKTKPAKNTNGKARRKPAKAITKKRKPKDKQKFIAGTEPEVHADIEAAADDYDAECEAHRGTKSSMDKSLTVLIERMKKRGLSEYKMSDGRFVFVIPGNEKAKITHKKDEKKHETNGAMPLDSGGTVFKQEVKEALQDAGVTVIEGTVEKV